MSFCEFFAARDAKYPPETINNGEHANGFIPFSDDEEAIFARMMEQQ